MRKFFLYALILTMSFQKNAFADIVFRNGEDLSVSIDKDEALVVHTALELFSKDYHRVFAGAVKKEGITKIFISTIGMNPEIEKVLKSSTLNELKQQTEGFIISVQNDNLYIFGNDKRGTAYGILELSRIFGVSPWEWWADVPVEKKDIFIFKNGFFDFQYPSVRFRGIFINDEDWGLTPWSSKTFEPGIAPIGKTKGTIGPQTYSKVFELLLRLRANTIWPAMHEVTTPFYFVKGNKEVADKYGIIVGTSHCEPLMRNSATEWDISGKGEYNYTTNKEELLRYWTGRLKELKESDNIYTIGLRGKHDGMMQGVKTLEQHKEVLADVIHDERELLKKYTNNNVKESPQVFIPYKEVLDVYNDGLEVPEDITLIWCDDNYGYIRHFPNETERSRVGGNGIYYHISYWGRPHDYLWLATNHPAHIYTQMKMAYDKGANKIWILNVGDIKPAEYLTELFLDMAWNIHSIEDNVEGLNKHLFDWLAKSFDNTKAKELLSVMNEYYRLAYIRKPEFMGGTRTEENDPKYKTILDLPWSNEEIHQRIKEYNQIEKKVMGISKSIAVEKKDAWFQLVEYPVRCAAEMNKKFLYGQLARQGKADWNLSDIAFDSIVQLTDKYNAIGNGKWKYIMDYQPRKLPVFSKVQRLTVNTPETTFIQPFFVFNGTDYASWKGMMPVTHGLGYTKKAISLLKGSIVHYRFNKLNSDSISLQIALAPNHPVDGRHIRFAIQLNNEPEQVFDFATTGRSEEWKENVLNNQANRIAIFKTLKSRKQILKIRALDEGVIIDQIKVFKL